MKSLVKLVSAFAAAVPAILLVAATPLPAGAQAFPTKPVRVVISFPAGSATDVIGRVVTQKLSDIWGHSVVADNRGGAGGSIGANVVAKATPDGYTLLINSSAHTVNPSLYAHLPYDTLKDFVEVAPLAATPNVLVVNPSSPIKTLAEFIAEAKAKPGQINFASAGVGSGTHLNLEKFKLIAHIDVTHVPYKGTPEVVTDIIGGRVGAYFAPVSATLAFIQSGKLRAIAVSSIKRSSQLPNVPTMAESGVPGFDFALWFGMWAPARTPSAIVDKISSDTARALASPDVRDQLGKLSMDAMNMTRKEFSAYVRKEIEDNAKIMRAAGIKPQ